MFYGHYSDHPAELHEDTFEPYYCELACTCQNCGDKRLHCKESACYECGGKAKIPECEVGGSGMRLKMYPRHNGYSKQGIKQGVQWVYTDVACPRCGKVKVTGFIMGKEASVTI